jgi:hypothetical protein
MKNLLPKELEDLEKEIEMIMNDIVVCEIFEKPLIYKLFKKCYLAGLKRGKKIKESEI